MTPRADILFENGPVFTGVGALTPAREPVAVVGERIAAVGCDALDLAGRRTERVDLGGSLLIPAFQDAHVHPVSAGLALSRCDLSNAGTARQCLEAVAKFAADNPDAAWVVGTGWPLHILLEGATDVALDAVIPDRPAFLTSRDCHSAWVNSRALELAGIGPDTPNPRDGIIERNAHGQPNGILHEGAIAAIERVLPEISEDELDRAFDKAQAYLHSLGIAGWQDALVGSALGMPDGFDVYVRAAVSGRLTARVRGALWWDRAQGLDQIDRLCDRRQRGRDAGNGRFDPGSVKIMQDGIIENHTASLTEPYVGGNGLRASLVRDGRGISFLESQPLEEAVVALDKLGFQLHFHAIGDRAIRQALDALGAAASAHGIGDHLHHIAHMQLLDPDDIPKLALLKVSATMQPLWACLDDQMKELTVPQIGSQRAAWQYPLAALVDAGVSLAFGSDWPISSPDPIAGLHVAVNRTVPAVDDKPLGGHQRIALGQALRAYTDGAARINHLHDTGRICPGMIADLAVLENDPFDRPVSEIYDNWTIATYVAGKQVS